MRINIIKALAYAALVAALFLAAGPAHSQILTRGLRSDLSNSADRFLSLDINGDGRADMLYFRPGSGYAGVYLSHGDGTFRYIGYVNGGTSESGFPGDLSDSRDTFTVLDLNGDGKDDFIEYRPGSGYAFACLSKGDGSVNCSNLSTPNGQSLGFQDNMMNPNTSIIPFKMNGSALSGFLVLSPSPSGNGSARAYITSSNNTDSNVTLTAITLRDPNTGNLAAGWQEIMYVTDEKFVPLDLNGDGYTDLLVFAPTYPVVRAYINQHNNTFRVVNYALSTGDSNGFTGMASNPNARIVPLDLNGDGKSDFLWIESGAGAVKAFLSNGDGTLTAVNYLVAGQSSNGFVDSDTSTADQAVALDLNGDGKSDFIWYSPGNGVMTAYLSSSNGSGSITPTVYYSNERAQNGFSDPTTRSSDIVLPLNFLGQAASGFAWYSPGNGLFQAYSPANTGAGVSYAGVNYYGFVAYPGSFLSDLNWSIGNIPLKEVVMPGTHDSSMYNLVLGVGDISECQWGDYPYQLASGARYFDFRTGYFVFVAGSPYDVDGIFALVDTNNFPESDGFWMYGHSSILTSYDTASVLNQIENWLIANPNEVVLLDVNNNGISGSQRDKTNDFAQLLANTQHPDLIYTQQAACGSAHCTDPGVFPQNMTINQLKTKGNGYYGARLILVNTPGELAALGWGWGSADSQVGYCGSGVTYASYEIDCINNGSGGSTLFQERPTYRAADAATNFMHVVAALTPGGKGGLLVSPLNFADGLGIIPGFNNGNDSNDLNQQLLNGAWSANALNMVTIDGLGHDDVPNLLIQRNNQTWVNTHFFHSVFPQPAGALSIGANGDIWAAGAGHSTSIFKYNATNNTWLDLINSEPNVQRLAVDPQGGVYAVIFDTSDAGPLIHFDKNGQNRQVLPNHVEDVAVGADGSVWAIGDVGNLFQVAAAPGKGYINVGSQSGVRVAVDNRGYPWVVQQDGSIHRYDANQWVQFGAHASEIAAAADGSLFIVGSSTASVLRYNPSTNNFDDLIMDASRVAADPGGHPWAIRSANGYVYRGALDQM